MRHTFRLISLPSLPGDDLKFPDAVYCSTFDGRPILLSLSLNLVTVLIIHAQENLATLFCFFCDTFAAAAGL